MPRSVRYKGTFACGHVGWIYEQPKSRRLVDQRLAIERCVDCRRASADTAASAFTDAEGLPALLGTERQVKWALVIRHGRLTEMAGLDQRIDLGDPMKLRWEALCEEIRGRRSAHWWIETREPPTVKWLRSIAQELWPALATDRSTSDAASGLPVAGYDEQHPRYLDLRP